MQDEIFMMFSAENLSKYVKGVDVIIIVFKIANVAFKDVLCLMWSLGTFLISLKLVRPFCV
jgi:hypothetical protein